MPADENDLPDVEPGATFEATWLSDLDGDGLRDLDLTPSTGFWNKVWPHLLYLSRDCSYAGSLLDADLSLASTSTRGLRDIEATSSTGCAGWDFVWSRYTWDGSRYHQSRTVSCCLPEECDACSGEPSAFCRGVRERM